MSAERSCGTSASRFWRGNFCFILFYIFEFFPSLFEHCYDTKSLDIKSLESAEITILHI